MKFSNEEMERAMKTKSAEELCTLAHENGKDLTKEEADRYFGLCHKEGEVSDDELDNVVGGCGGNDDEEECEPTYQYYCPNHGKGMEEHRTSFAGMPIVFYACPDCNYGYIVNNGVLTPMPSVFIRDGDGWTIRIC